MAFKSNVNWSKVSETEPDNKSIDADNDDDKSVNSVAKIILSSLPTCPATQ